MEMGSGGDAEWGWSSEDGSPRKAGPTTAKENRRTDMQRRHVGTLEEDLLRERSGDRVGEAEVD